MPVLLSSQERAKPLKREWRLVSWESETWRLNGWDERMIWNETRRDAVSFLQGTNNEFMNFFNNIGTFYLKLNATQLLNCRTKQKCNNQQLILRVGAHLCVCVCVACVLHALSLAQAEHIWPHPQQPLVLFCVSCNVCFWSRVCLLGSHFLSGRERVKG